MKIPITILMMPILVIIGYGSYCLFKDAIRHRDLELLLFGWLILSIGIFLTFGLIGLWMEA